MTGDAQVLVVGAGPAGASLACVLAQRGVRVVLLERQRDFAREFRGEVLLPDGVDALHQMGLARALAAAPHAMLLSSGPGRALVARHVRPFLLGTAPLPLEV